MPHELLKHTSTRPSSSVASPSSLTSPLVHSVAENRCDENYLTHVLTSFIQYITINITIPASQTSYTLRDNVRPFTRYTFQVFANFGDGLVVLIVAPFSTQTGEARTLLYSSMVLTVWCMCLHNTYLYLDFLSDPLGTFGQFCTSFM